MRNSIEKSLDDEKDLDLVENTFVENAVDQFSDSEERRIMYVTLAILPIRALT
jgi:hypothetical protein